MEVRTLEPRRGLGNVGVETPDLFQGCGHQWRVGEWVSELLRFSSSLPGRGALVTRSFSGRGIAQMPSPSVRPRQDPGTAALQGSLLPVQWHFFRG